MSEAETGQIENQQSVEQSEKNTEQKQVERPVASDENSDDSASKQVEEEVKAEEVKLDQKDKETEDELIQDNPEKAQQHKNKGAQHFKNGDEFEAIQQYEKAIQYASDRNLRSILCSNIAICLIKEQAFSQAKKYCLKALKYNQDNRKARTNYARCLEAEQKLDDALQEYKKLEVGAQANEVAFIRDKIKILQPKVDEINEKKKQQVINGLKGIGNSILGYFGMSLDNFKLEKGEGGGYNIQFKQ